MSLLHTEVLCPKSEQGWWEGHQIHAGEGCGPQKTEEMLHFGPMTMTTLYWEGLHNWTQGFQDEIVIVYPQAEK